MKLGYVFFGLALGLLPVTADAQSYIQDNVFGDNITQNNYYPRPVRKVVRQTRPNNRTVVNNTYIINQVNPAPQPQVIERTVTVTRSIPVPQPYIPPPPPAPYYYPPGYFY